MSIRETPEGKRVLGSVREMIIMCAAISAVLVAFATAIAGGGAVFVLQYRFSQTEMLAVATTKVAATNRENLLVIKETLTTIKSQNDYLIQQDQRERNSSAGN